MLIIKPGDERFPLLKARSLECDMPFGEKEKLIIKELTETLKEEIDGRGLSAVQIGYARRIFVMKIGEEIKYFINPIILTKSKLSAPKSEGCLSLPNVFVRISRPSDITLQYYNLDGELMTEQFLFSNARCICHEIDHLDGILIVDHLEKILEKEAAKKHKKSRIRQLQKAKRRKKNV